MRCVRMNEALLGRAILPWHCHKQRTLLDLYDTNQKPSDTSTGVHAGINMEPPRFTFETQTGREGEGGG